MGNSVSLSFSPGALRIEPYSGFSLDSSSSSTSVTAGDTPYRAQLTRTYHVADALKTALEAMQDAIGSGAKQARAANVRSANDLGLSAISTAATLRSSEEVNATPTSYTPFGPDWTGNSTALATVDGIYDGDQGTDTLRFVVQRGGTVGEDAVKICMYDGEGKSIQTKTFGEDYVPGTTTKFKNGLRISLDAGSLTKNDEFYVNVSTVADSEVDPAKSLDGLRNDRPNLEYGLSVTAGSFDVNGTTIDVFSSDSLDDVLGRITANVEDVTATYDSATEKVVLAHDQMGSEYDITVGNDTSGFLEATKLDTAVLEPGIDGEAEEMIVNVDPLNGVTTGTAYVNGEAITVDILNDSLQDVIARVNASDAGVVMTLSEDAQRVTITSADKKAPLTLSDGDTNLWSELGLPLGETKPRTRAGIDSDAMVEAMGDLKRALNAMFQDRAGESGVSAVVTGLRTSLRSAIGDAFESNGAELLRSGFGVDFDFRDQSFETMDYSRSRLRSALATRPSEVLSFFSDGDDASSGMVTSMISTLSGSMGAIENTLGHVGLNVDVKL